MQENLVIVESPAKAKTIEKFLGKDYVVKSSFGHIRDLSKKDLGINIGEGFKPVYEIPADKKKVVDELTKYDKFNFYLSYLVSSYLFRLSSIIRSPLAVEIPRKKLLIICTKASRSVIPAGSISSLRATSAEAV